MVSCKPFITAEVCWHYLRLRSLMRPRLVAGSDRIPLRMLSACLSRRRSEPAAVAILMACVIKRVVWITAPAAPRWGDEAGHTTSMQFTISLKAGRRISEAHLKRNTLPEVPGRFVLEAAIL